MATFNLSNRVLLTNTSPNVDSEYGPYASISDATTAITLAQRTAGKTVGIITGGIVTEYWWKDNATLSSDPLIKASEQDLQSVTTKGSTTTNSITAESFIKNGGTSTQFLMGDGSVTIGNGGVYSYEIHVSQIDGNDTTGTGAVLNPVASITKALTLITGLRRTIVIHPGNYTENPSITTQYTVLTTYAQLGGNTALSGTITTNTGCTISGLKMTNLTVNGVSGRGNINILSCDITGTFTKNGTADYTLIRFCDIGALNILSTAGVLAIFGGNPSFITVNSVGASVLVKNAVCISPVVLVGNATFADCILISTGSTTNALTSSAGTVITLANSQCVIPTFQNVSRVSLSGFYSILNCVYDKPNSTLVASSLTGGSTSSIVYSQFMNADKFIKQGGTGANILLDDGNTLAVSTIPTVTPSALTKTNDTNVTLTLGGSPSTALLQGVSLTLGWTGTLADSRIASASTWNAKENVLTFSSPLSRSVNTVSMLAATTLVDGYLTSTNWTNFNTAYTSRIATFTVTGNSGAATFSGNTLNIPEYTISGLNGAGLALANTFTNINTITKNDSVNAIFNVNNSLAGGGIFVSSSAGTAAEIRYGAASGSIGVRLYGLSSGNGTPLSVYDGSTLVSQINSNGTIIGTVLKVFGGSTNGFLKANGDIDSVTYSPSPTTITSSTTNLISGSTHTHAITPSLGFIGAGGAQYQVAVTGATTFTPTWTSSANIYGSSGLNSLSYSVSSFIKMTGANTFILDPITNYAPIASPTFTGTPSLTTTPTAGDNTTKLASTEFVKTAIDTGVVSNITITTSGVGTITTETLSTIGSYSQNGRNVMIDNAAVFLNIDVTTTTPANFIASYTKLGIADILFRAGTGTTLTGFPSGNGLLAFIGAPGSTALLTRTGNTFYVQINNLV